MTKASTNDWLFPDMNPPRAATAVRPKRICFDIEIANVFELAPGEDLEDRGPFDISVAAASDEHDTVRHWCARDEQARPHKHLDAALAREFLGYLREMQLAGVQVCAWNGMSFDARWLGVAARDERLAAEVALDLYDPLFQFVARRGFPIGLAAAAEGLGISEKKLMAGADAPREWARGNHALVLDYVAGDCRLTARVIAAIEAAGAVRWRTKKGTLSSEPFPALRRVRDVMRDPPPDQSWMSTPKPWKRWFAWLDACAPSAVQ